VNEALFDAPLQPVDDVVHKPADACRDCIHDGAFHIIRHVAEHIKEHCDKGASIQPASDDPDVISLK